MLSNLVDQAQAIGLGVVVIGSFFTGVLVTLGLVALVKLVKIMNKLVMWMEWMLCPGRPYYNLMERINPNPLRKPQNPSDYGKEGQDWESGVEYPHEVEDPEVTSSENAEDLAATHEQTTRFGNDDPEFISTEDQR